MTTPSTIHHLGAPVVIGDPTGARLVVAPDQRTPNLLLDLRGHPTPYDTYADDDPRWSWVVYDTANEVVHADYGYDCPEDAMQDGHGYFESVRNRSAEAAAGFHAHTGF